MYQNNKILCVIPARGGSKGVPLKNIRMAGGKPLIAWIIQEARKSKYVDRLIVSSDDDRIIKASKDFGAEVPYKRPEELSGDSSSTASVIKHALMMTGEYDYAVTLQPTSPLTEAADIDNCIAKCISTDADACVSVTEVDKSPFWMFTKNDRDILTPLLDDKLLGSNRQSLPEIYIPNGAVYVTKACFLIENESLYSKQTVGYVMPKERSIDIDTEFDFVLLETLISHYKI